MSRCSCARKYTGTICSSTRRPGKMGICFEHSHLTSRVCAGMQPPAQEDKTGRWLKPNRRSTPPQGIASGALLALPVKGAANLCSAQVTVSFTRGKIPPPHPTAPILLALGPKSQTCTGVFMPLRYSTQTPKLSSACTHLFPSAIWQQRSLSLGIQITSK